MVLLGKNAKRSFGKRALMARSGAVLLQGHRRVIGAVADRTDQLYRCVLQTVVIDEEAFVKVGLAVHERRVVLVHKSYILVQIPLIEDPVEALDGTIEAVRIALDAALITDAIVGNG